jgi:hypothetical protein
MYRILELPESAFRSVWTSVRPECSPHTPLTHRQFAIGGPHVLPKAMYGLVDLVSSIFESVGWTDVDKTQGIIEYWRYHDFHGSDRVSYPLDVHRDDHGVVSFCVYTAIVYGECTITDGGHLMIYSDDFTFRSRADIVDSIEPRASLPDHSRIVLLRGDVPHDVEIIRSAGVRECIVVQLRRA